MKLTNIEGIGEVYAARLGAQGISTTAGLLKEGNTPKGRKELAERTGISDQLILDWVNHADLMRVKGVGSEYSDLLEAAGVDTVKELRQRNPENLYAAMGKLNEEKNLVRRLPSQAEVTAWIEHAKTLEAVITY